MNISNKNRSQFELFPKNSDPSHPYPDNQRFRAKIKDLTLSLENIIVLCIVLVMVFVLFFSFGVERGRRLAMEKAGINEEQLAEETPPQENVVIVKEPKAAKEPAKEETIPIEAAEERQIIQIPIERQLSEEDLYTIQVASFRKSSSAQKEIERIGNIGHDIFVMDKGEYSIVCVGKFAVKDQARELSKKLRSRYSDLLVRRL